MDDPPLIICLMDVLVWWVPRSGFVPPCLPLWAAACWGVSSLVRALWRWCSALPLFCAVLEIVMSFLPAFLVEEAAAQALLKAQREKEEAQRHARFVDGTRVFAQQRVVDTSFKAFFAAEQYRKVCSR